MPTQYIFLLTFLNERILPNIVSMYMHSITQCANKNASIVQTEGMYLDRGQSCCHELQAYYMADPLNVTTIECLAAGNKVITLFFV